MFFQPCPPPPTNHTTTYRVVHDGRQPFGRKEGNASQRHERLVRGSGGWEQLGNRAEAAEPRDFSVEARRHLHGIVAVAKKKNTWVERVVRKKKKKASKVK